MIGAPLAGTAACAGGMTRMLTGLVTPTTAMIATTAATMRPAVRRCSAAASITCDDQSHEGDPGVSVHGLKAYG